MKVKALQFEKAMSAALFVLLLVAVGMKNALAQNEVATLQHGDDMTAFYGRNAFVEAHAAATDGDVITLSSGTFNKTDITKAIILHGAGCVSDTLGNTPTIITGGTLYLDVPNDSVYLIIEGIAFQSQIQYRNNLYNAKIIKCNLSGLNWSNNSGTMVNDVQIINCWNCQGYDVTIKSMNNSVSVINSVIRQIGHYGGDYVNVYNSIIGSSGNYSGFNLHSCIVTNNNIHQFTNSYAYNCIEIGNMFSNSVTTFNCILVDAYSDVFESFDGTYSNNSDFHLKEEIATTFLGNDGTEVGIYGGMMPYKIHPSYMILNRCNVAPRSTIDGKLSVDIEVLTGHE